MQIRQNNPILNPANTNPLGSLFALEGNYQVQEYLRAHIDSRMVNGWPKRFTDMTLFGQKKGMSLKTDEFWWPVNEYDRQGLISSAQVTGGANSLTVPVVTVDGAFVDMEVSWDGGKGVISAVNPSTTSVTIKGLRNTTLPTILAGTSFAFVAPSTSFTRRNINFNYRMKPTMLKNYISIMAGIVQYNWDELQKIGDGDLNAIANFLGTEFDNFLLHMKISQRNKIWQSTRGEYILDGNNYTKSTGGIRWFMQNYGSPTANPTRGNFADTIQTLCRLTQYKENGARKYLFASPDLIEVFMESYKSTNPTGVASNVRYAPNDMIANLNLSQVDYLTSTVIPVSIQAFTDQTSFSRDYGNIFFLIDAEYVETVDRAGFNKTNDLDMSKFSHSMGVERMIQTSVGVKMSIPQTHAYGFVN
jgi:hypothetical protein